MWKRGIRTTSKTSSSSSSGWRRWGTTRWSCRRLIRAAVDYLTKNVIAYVKERPAIQIFDFWPPDGARWCECEKCKALGTPSDRQVILANHVNQAMKAILKRRLEIIAYAAALHPPEHV